MQSPTVAIVQKLTLKSVSSTNYLDPSVGMAAGGQNEHAKNIVWIAKEKAPNRHCAYFSGLYNTFLKTHKSWYTRCGPKISDDVRICHAKRRHLTWNFTKNSLDFPVKVVCSTIDCYACTNGSRPMYDEAISFGHILLTHYNNPWKSSLLQRPCWWYNKMCNRYRGPELTTVHAP